MDDSVLQAESSLRRKNILNILQERLLLWSERAAEHYEHQMSAVFTIVVLLTACWQACIARTLRGTTSHNLYVRQQ
jgi:hypothetical protein